MEFPGVLKKKNVEIVRVNKKRSEFFWNSIMASKNLINTLEESSLMVSCAVRISLGF